MMIIKIMIIMIIIIVIITIVIVIMIMIVACDIHLIYIIKFDRLCNNNKHTIT